MAPYLAINPRNTAAGSVLMPSASFDACTMCLCQHAFTLILEGGAVRKVVLLHHA